MKKILLSTLILLMFTLISNAQNTKMHVKLTGGSNSGTYDFNSSTTTCSCNIMKDIAFGNQFSLKDGKGVTSLQLIAPNRANAMVGTDVFYVSVAFGKRLMGPKYELGTESVTITAKANGTLKLSETTNSTVADISGTTKARVKMEIKLECLKMMTSTGAEVNKCQ